LTQTELAYITTTLLAIAAIAAAIWWIVRWRSAVNRELQRLLKTVSEDTLIDFVIPNGAGGEIHIDHLLLTSHGLILLDTKDMVGSIFAGDQLDTWSATHLGARMTFNNPIPLLEERTAALKLLAPQVPIESRVLFTHQATFPKGHPEQVSTVQALIDDYGKVTQETETHDFSREWQNIKVVATTA
jgi:hypothetical protein